MKDDIDVLCDEENLQNFKLSPRQWGFVGMIVDFLKDFKSVVRRVNEENITLPESVVSINCLLHQVEKYSSD